MRTRQLQRQFAGGLHGSLADAVIHMDQRARHLIIPAFVGGASHGNQGARLPVGVLTMKRGFDQRDNFETEE